MTTRPREIQVVDSHTEGEPTRVVVAGWPEPKGATMRERREWVAREQEGLWRGTICEPRGHKAVIGALLTPPVEPGSDAGVVYFDNAGVLGMCGHGTIGVVRTLEFLGRVEAGSVRLDTPVGTVSAVLDDDGAVTIQNVPARCLASDVAVDVPGLGRVVGDVAWGGNWFFVTELKGLDLGIGNLIELTDVATRIRRALATTEITGEDGAEIDHVELFGPPTREDADSANFVLCPSLTYDRSPCGTGTSAKMAALVAHGKLGPGERWRQQGIAGGVFTGWVEERDGQLIPFIQGRAYVTGRGTLIFQDDDPFRDGIPEP